MASRIKDDLKNVEVSWKQLDVSLGFVPVYSNLHLGDFKALVATLVRVLNILTLNTLRCETIHKTLKENNIPVSPSRETPIQLNLPCEDVVMQMQQALNSLSKLDQLEQDSCKASTIDSKIIQDIKEVDWALRRLEVSLNAISLEPRLRGLYWTVMWTCNMLLESVSKIAISCLADQGDSISLNSSQAEGDISDGLKISQTFLSQLAMLLQKNFANEANERLLPVTQMEQQQQQQIEHVSSNDDSIKTIQELDQHLEESDDEEVLRKSAKGCKRQSLNLDLDHPQFTFKITEATKDSDELEHYETSRSFNNSEVNDGSQHDFEDNSQTSSGGPSVADRILQDWNSEAVQQLPEPSLNRTFRFSSSLDEDSSSNTSSACDISLTIYGGSACKKPRLSDDHQHLDQTIFNAARGQHKPNETLWSQDGNGVWNISSIKLDKLLRSNRI